MDKFLVGLLPGLEQTATKQRWLMTAIALCLISGIAAAYKTVPEYDLTDFGHTEFEVRHDSKVAPEDLHRLSEWQIHSGLARPSAIVEFE